MIRLSLHQNDYLATTKHYLSVYRTSTIQADSNQARPILQNVLIFAVLSPYGNEQADLLARVVREDPVKNDDMGWVGGFVKRFTDGELMRFVLLVGGLMGLGGLWFNRFMGQSCVLRMFLGLIKVMEKVKNDGKLYRKELLNMYFPVPTPRFPAIPPPQISQYALTWCLERPCRC
jgi:hypothetical protein